MKYLIILLITLGSINVPDLHAGAGTAAYLARQADCGGRCPSFFERKIRSYFEDSEPEEEYDHDDGNDGEYDGGYYDESEYEEYLDYLDYQSE